MTFAGCGTRLQYVSRCLRQHLPSLGSCAVCCMAMLFKSTPLPLVSCAGCALLLAEQQGQSDPSATRTVATHVSLFHATSCAAGSTQPLKKAPAWLKRPAGVAFGFGNRLVSFSNTMQQSQDGQMAGVGSVTIQQVGRLLHRTLQACMPRGERKGGQRGGIGRLAPVLNGISAFCGLMAPHCPPASS